MILLSKALIFCHQINLVIFYYRLIIFEESIHHELFVSELKVSQIVH